MERAGVRDDATRIARSDAAVQQVTARDTGAFVTPEEFSRQQARRMVPPRGELLLLGCRSGDEFARALCNEYNALLLAHGSDSRVACHHSVDFQFSDTETCARLERGVDDRDVFVVQALRDARNNRSVDENLMALLVTARALREWGARHVSAVLPYLAYGRQDKPTRFQREPTTAKLVIDLLLAAGVDRLIAWHPHSEQVHGFTGVMAVDLIEPLGYLVETFAEYDGRGDTVVVAPDRGAAELAGDLARALNLGVAYSAKHRPRPEEARVTDIVGSLEGKRVALVIDDMLATGGTFEAVIQSLVLEHGVQEVHAAISHHLGLPGAEEVLQRLHARWGLRRLIATDSVPQPAWFLELPFVSVNSLARPMAQLVNAVHYGKSLCSIFSRDPYS